jgi:hypothetical protein
MSVFLEYGLGIYFIGFLISFLGSFILEIALVGISDHKSSVREKVKGAFSWPLMLIKIIAGLIA